MVATQCRRLKMLRSRLLTFGTDYSTLANALDYSTVVIPVSTADKALDPFDDQYEPLNEKDRLNWLSCKNPMRPLWSSHAVDILIE